MDIINKNVFFQKCECVENIMYLCMITGKMTSVETSKNGERGIRVNDGGGKFI
jgi:hypothetical protein